MRMRSRRIRTIEIKKEKQLIIKRERSTWMMIKKSQETYTRI